MIEIYLFSLFWLATSGYNLFSALKEDDANEDMGSFEEVMEMEKFVSPDAIAKMMPVLYTGTLAVDILGFYLAYYHAYINVSENFYRIMFFFSCACIFLTEQTIAMRYTFRISAAIRKLEHKPEVLRRWIDMNEPNQKTIIILSAITKFTIALQLTLFTVIDSLLV